MLLNCWRHSAFGCICAFGSRVHQAPVAAKSHDRRCPTGVKEIPGVADARLSRAVDKHRKGILVAFRSDYQALQATRFLAIKVQNLFVRVACRFFEY